MKFVGDNWSCQIMVQQPLCVHTILYIASVYHLIYYRVTYNPVNVCFNSTRRSSRRPPQAAACSAARSQQAHSNRRRRRRRRTGIIRPRDLNS